MNEFTVEDIRNELFFDIMFIKERFFNDLTEKQMNQLDEEIDRKISVLLPSYDGSISIADAFKDIIENTIIKFVQQNKL